MRLVSGKYRSIIRAINEGLCGINCNRKIPMENPLRIVCARVTCHGRTFKGESRARTDRRGDFFTAEGAACPYLCPVNAK